MHHHHHPSRLAQIHCAGLSVLQMHHYLESGGPAHGCALYSLGPSHQQVQLAYRGWHRRSGKEERCQGRQGMAGLWADWLGEGGGARIHHLGWILTSGSDLVGSISAAQICADDFSMKI